MGSKLPPKGTPISLAIVEDRRKLGSAVFERVRRAQDAPAATDDTARWFFMVGWLARSVAFGLPDDPDLVLQAIANWTEMTGEASALRKKKGN